VSNDILVSLNSALGYKYNLEMERRKQISIVTVEGKKKDVASKLV